MNNADRIKIFTRQMDLSQNMVDTYSICQKETPSQFWEAGLRFYQKQVDHLQSMINKLKA